MKLLLFTFIITISGDLIARSRPSICEQLKLDTCNNSKRPLSRSAGASLPTVNSAAFNNPAAISLNRGVGIESIHYDSHAQLGIISGTGRIGAAISNFPSDGTFFGNTAIESVNDYRLRAVDGKRYEPDKTILAAGLNLYGGKRRKGLGLDIGVMYRRDNELEKSFGGGGVVISINKVLSIGASLYRDVYYQDLRNKVVTVVDASGNKIDYLYSDDSVNITEEYYNVRSYVIGLKISKMAFDFIEFTTESQNEVYDGISTKIYNLSYFHRKWIFSYGRRFESSFKEIYEDEVFITQEDKSFTLLGVQYATDSGFLLGVFTNYYLLNDLSLGLTYFF